MNLWVRGEGGHPAWLGGCDPADAFKVAPIGCTPANGLRMKFRCLRRLGFDVSLTPGPVYPGISCGCGACYFLSTAASDAYIKNRTLDESPPYRALPDRSLVDRRTGALIRKGGDDVTRSGKPTG